MQFCIYINTYIWLVSGFCSSCITELKLGKEEAAQVASQFWESRREQDDWEN